MRHITASRSFWTRFWWKCRPTRPATSHSSTSRTSIVSTRSGPRRWTRGTCAKEPGTFFFFTVCVYGIHMFFIASIRAAWVQKIKAASEHFIETEKKKREKAYQGKHNHAFIHILAIIECIDRASWHWYKKIADKQFVKSLNVCTSVTSCELHCVSPSNFQRVYAVADPSLCTCSHVC